LVTSIALQRTGNRAMVDIEKIREWWAENEKYRYHEPEVRQSLNWLIAEVERLNEELTKAERDYTEACQDATACAHETREQTARECVDILRFGVFLKGNASEEYQRGFMDAGNQLMLAIKEKYKVEGETE